MPWQRQPHTQRWQSCALRRGVEWQLWTSTSDLLTSWQGLSKDILQKGTEMYVYALPKWPSTEGVKTRLTMRACSWINVGLSINMWGRKKVHALLKLQRAYKSTCQVQSYITQQQKEHLALKLCQVCPCSLHVGKSEAGFYFILWFYMVIIFILRRSIECIQCHHFVRCRLDVLCFQKKDAW